MLASGLEDGLYHQYAQRYKEILAREGVTVEERMTGGADENEQLLHDPKSGVDVAFMHGGDRPAAAERGNLDHARGALLRAALDLLPRRRQR